MGRRRFPLPLPLLVLTALLLPGCDEEPPDEPKPRTSALLQGQGIRPAEFDQSRELALRQFQESQKRAMAMLEKRVKELEKKGEKEKEKKAQERDHPSDSKQETLQPDSLTVASSSRHPVAQMPDNWKEKKKGESVFIDTKEGQPSNRFVQVASPRNKAQQESGREVKAFTEGLQRVGDPARKEEEKKEGLRQARQVKPGETAVLNPPDDDPSWWQKLFGARKEADAAALAVGKPGDPPQPQGGTADMKSTLSRLRKEMAARRLEMAGASAGAAAAEAAKAGEAVELPASPPPPSPPSLFDPDRAKTVGDTATEPKRADPVAEAQAREAEPKTVEEAEQARQEAERKVLEGLGSKDLVRRRVAFEYAAAYRKREAIPYLIKELRENGVWASQAAAHLSAFGEASQEIVRVLLDHLQAKDAPLRENVIASLGVLRVREAVKPLLELLKTELNFQIRMAICEALGYIRDPEAAQALKERLQRNDEVHLVKAGAALALARLNDHAGEKFLISLFQSDSPQLQIMGLSGLVQLGNSDVGAFLATALGSRYEEVWVAAVNFFPYLGPQRALPILQDRLKSTYPAMQRRAAIALGMLGSPEGARFLVEALAQGNARERTLSAGLLGLLSRREAIPPLIEALRDPQSQVRVAAAVALARLKAQEALPRLIELARGARADKLAPSGLRGTLPEVDELVAVLGAIRSLKGEKGELAIEGLPDQKTTRWESFDKPLFTHQVDLVKAYKLIDVLSAGAQAQAAILNDPNGREILLKRGEQLAGGFVLRDLLPAIMKGEQVVTQPCVTLVSGETFVTLVVGRDPEVSVRKQKGGSD